jgi:hypothetical protein
MGAVGQSIITANGIKALMDASAVGKLIKPKYFKFSETDYALDPTIENINGWIQKDITLYNTINENTIEFVCDVAPEEAAKYTKTAGLYLDDGTLFMLAKPPFPFPPMLRQTFKIQLVYQNAENLIDFSYLPFYETEQDLAILQNSASIGELALKTSEDIGMLQIAKADYYKFKEATNERLNNLETRANESEANISDLELTLLETNASLGNEILKNGKTKIPSPKQKKEKFIYVSNEGKKLLKKYFSEEKGYSLLSERKNRFHSIALINDVNSYLKIVFPNKNITSHSFRQTLISDLMSKSVNPKVVQTLVGHKNVQTTLGYYKPSEDDLFNALETR